jgi:hypothetical protein
MEPDPSNRTPQAPAWAATPVPRVRRGLRRLAGVVALVLALGHWLVSTSLSALGLTSLLLLMALREAGRSMANEPETVFTARPPSIRPCPLCCLTCS